MDYFDVLHLDREPFSSSPDPDFFFLSREHRACLQKIELSIRMRRGLNVVLGAVGSGKTTLCRQLLRNFADDDRFSLHLILDPQFESEKDFLRAVAGSLEGVVDGDNTPAMTIKEQIKQHLFKKGVEEEKIIVLVIDEGQKIPSYCLEVLRELLNYETNTYKLLQIVIFAQNEFEPILQAYENFADRINLFHRLRPLGFFDARAMIRFRIRRACDAPDPPDLFTIPAVWAIYRGSRGYPRKMIHLCHQCLLAMIVQNRDQVDWFIARACSRRRIPAKSAGWKKAIVVAAMAFLAVLVWFRQAGIEIPLDRASEKKTAIRENQPAGADALPVYAGGIVSARQSTEKPTLSMDRNGAEKSGKTQSPRPASETEPLNIKGITALRPHHADALENQAPGTGNKSENAGGNPAYIGTTTAAAYEPLSEMIQNVYGLYDQRMMARVLAANPEIKNPDKIFAGQKIRFPSIIARKKPIDTGRCWIEIAKYHQLDRAYAWTKSLPASGGFSARLIPHHTSAGGLQISIIVKEYFASESGARSRLDELKEQLGPQAGVLTRWDPDTVFFSDPYSGPIGS